MPTYLATDSVCYGKGDDDEHVLFVAVERTNVGSGDLIQAYCLDPDCPQYGGGKCVGPSMIREYQGVDP